MRTAGVGTIDRAEVVSKLVERGASDALARDAVAGLDLTVVPLDRETAGLVRAATRRAGLSLGDRCWLALAGRTGRIAAATDRARAKVQVGVAIEILR